MLRLIALFCPVLFASGPAVAPSAGASPQEREGVIVLEAESADIHGNWVIHPNPGTPGYLEGAMGEGCIQFTGNTEVSGPPDSPLSYRLKIPVPGTYRLVMRALEAPVETGEGDKANDCYIRLEGQEGWKGAFTKFVLLGESFQWSWNVLGEPRHHEFEPPEYELEAGEALLQVAGRSKNFCIDRIVLYPADRYTGEEITGAEMVR